MRLGRCLAQQRLKADLVLGLPRGGVIVAAEVARLLHLPLDTLIVRKVGHPWNREFAVGALAEGGVVVLDEGIIGEDKVARGELKEIILEEEKRLQSYQAKFHLKGTPNLTGKAVLLVDDGIATGATTEAAVLSAKKRNASTVVVAAPVASTSAVDRLARVADEVRVVCVDPAFEAVGSYYETFSQTTDEEVIRVLKESVKRET